MASVAPTLPSLTFVAADSSRLGIGEKRLHQSSHRDDVETFNALQVARKPCVQELNAARAQKDQATG